MRWSETERGGGDVDPLDPDAVGPSSSPGRGLPGAGSDPLAGMAASVCDKWAARMGRRDRES